MGQKRKRQAEKEGKDRFNAPPHNHKSAPKSMFRFDDGLEDDDGRNGGKRQKVDFDDERGNGKGGEGERIGNGGKSGGSVRKKKIKGKKGLDVEDDTPKRFARLMAWRNQGRGLRKGLDDGVGRDKGKKKGVGKGKKPDGGTGLGVAQDGNGTNNGAKEGNASSMKNASAGQERKDTKSKVSKEVSNNDSAIIDTPDTDTSSTPPAAPLKILPSERLRDFSLRVDQSLPLSSIPRYSTKETLQIPGLKSKQSLTKHNEKLLRKQELWREEEKKIKEKKAALEQDGEMEDKREEEGLLWRDVEDAKGGRKGKKRKGERDGDGDIWKVLEMKRVGYAKRPVLTAGEAVKEPPKLGRVKNMFKVVEEGK